MTPAQQAELEQVAREWVAQHELVFKGDVKSLITLLAAQRVKGMEEFRAFLAVVTCVCEHSNIHGSQEFDRHHESWCPKLKADRKLASLAEEQRP